MTATYDPTGTCPNCGRRMGWDGHAYAPCTPKETPMTATTPEGIAAHRALEASHAEGRSHYRMRANDETATREGKLAALRAFSAAACGDMAMSEYAEMVMHAEGSRNAAFRTAYLTTLASLA